MTSIRFVDDPIGSHVKQMGRGPAVILLHDFLGPDLCWRGLETLLAEHYRVFYAIFPGFLPNDASSLINQDNHLRFIDAVFSFYELNNAILIGSGMGGNLAIQYTNQHPDRVKGIVLLHPSGLNTIPNFLKIPFSQFFFKHFILNNPSALRKYLAKNDIIDSNDTDLLPSNSCLLQSIKQYFQRDYSVYRNLESLKILIQLIWGENNQFIPFHCASELQGHLNSVKLKKISDTGYNILGTNQLEIFNTIHDYIKFSLKKVTHMP